MSLTGEDIYKRLHRKLVKEEEGLEALDDVDIEVYSLILIQARARQDMGRFGYCSKPPAAAGKMGLFLPDGTMPEKLKARNLGGCVHEWTYLSCSRFWLQMATVAGDLFRDAVMRTVGELDQMQTKMALAAWKDVFTDLAAKVMDYRVTFMRLACDSGVATAKAALSMVELTAQVSDLAAEEMARTRAEYQSAYLKAEMKQDAASAAAAKRAAKNADGESSARP